jgi:uncharacterized protein YdaU (DUF1376 family)
MTYVERGLYRELLDECWAEGFIADDVHHMAEICGCPVDVMASAWQVLSKCFRLLDGVWINDRMELERTERDSIRANRARAGKIGGLHKSLNEKETETSAKQVLASASKCHIEEKRREEKRIEETPSSDGYERDKDDPKRGEMILKSGEMFPVYDSDITKLEQTYQTIDVVYQLKMMKAWLESNPNKRKTKTGMPKFINSWLNRAANNG